MVRIRKVEISNFRAVKSLSWCPAEGINCLVGPGDSGKSTIPDAIDLCLGARRSANFADTDFFRLDVKHPVDILLTIGELPDALMNLDTYGEFLRGFGKATGEVEDEPSRLPRGLTAVHGRRRRPRSTANRARLGVCRLRPSQPSHCQPAAERPAGANRHP